MCLAQGNRLFNFYLFTGGHQLPPGRAGRRRQRPDRFHRRTPRLRGAPIGPEGQLNYTYARLARTVRTADRGRRQAGRSMDEEHDGVALGFIPDYYLTESVYPGSAMMREMVDNLTANRGGGPRDPGADAALRRLSLRRRRHPDEHSEQIAEPGDDTRSSPWPSARFMAGEIQQTAGRLPARGAGSCSAARCPSRTWRDVPAPRCSTPWDCDRPATVGTCALPFSVTAEGWAAPRPRSVLIAQVLDPTTGRGHPARIPVSRTGPAAVWT